jgi:hypothetical protein
VSFGYLHGPEIRCHILSEGLVEHLPVKPPSAAVRHERSIVVNSKPMVMMSDENVDLLLDNSYSLLVAISGRSE